MKANDIILQNCLTWVSDISVYRCRLNQLKKQIQGFKNSFSLEGRFDQFVAISHKYQSVCKKLSGIERKIIHTAYKHMKELYPAKVENVTLVENENELFDNMVMANKLLIDLQKTVYESLKPKNQSDINTNAGAYSSKIIDMPRTKKVSINARS